MDGAPLPLEHGFPARLIAPGLHGYKMPKWIERIELTDTPDGGFWESRGWSLDGTTGVTAAILSHQPNADGSVTLSGIAHAGARRIASVQVSVDGGDGMLIPFTPAEPFALTHWQTDWTPPNAGAGDYHVQVRVYGVNVLKPADHAVVVKVR
jgi:hypothetical protein